MNDHVVYGVVTGTNLRFIPKQYQNWTIFKWTFERDSNHLVMHLRVGLAYTFICMKAHHNFCPLRCRILFHRTHRIASHRVASHHGIALVATTSIASLPARDPWLSAGLPQARSRCPARHGIAIPHLQTPLCSYTAAQALICKIKRCRFDRPARPASLCSSTRCLLKAVLAWDRATHRCRR